VTLADVAAFVAERLARGLGVETGMKMQRLRALTASLAGLPPFASTEP
jgi:glutathione S-transferase